MEAADTAALQAALARNVWRGEAPDNAAAALARIVLAQDAHLASQKLTTLAAGEARFLAPLDALR
jgi:cytochrome b pre-mRNA-processing protein 3